MELKEFVVNVGPHGTFRPSGKYQTTTQDIDEIFQKFQADKPEKITIFFHGGLVNEEAGIETALKMATHFKNDNHAPLCFVWETGFSETLKANISKIASTEVFNKLVKVLVKKLSEKLGFDFADGRGAGQSLPDAVIENELNKEVPFENFDQDFLDKNNRGPAAITALPDNEHRYELELQAEFRQLIEPDYEFMQAIEKHKFTGQDQTEENIGGRGIISSALFIKSVAQIAFKVIKRFITKRDHGFYPTIIEEILRKLYIAEVGAWVWNEMKVKSQDMWGDNALRSNLNMFAGTYVLEKLIAHKKQFPEVQINLVGHSAGSIVICNLLQATVKRDSNFTYNKIAFMAPACRVDLFVEKLIANSSKFKEFKMYTMADAFEKKDRMVPYFYTHSLLYLISGILENEGKDYDSYILGMERYLLSEKPYHEAAELKAVIAYLSNIENSVVYSKSDVGSAIGLQTESLSHGGFDDDPATIKSVLHFLK